MKELTIINAWDKCCEAPQLQKGLILASLLFPNMQIEDIARWSIEKRDIALFHLRKILFGNKLTITCTCPACGERLEWDIFYKDLNLPAIETIPDNISLPLSESDMTPVVRLPNSIDLQMEDQNMIIKNCLNSNAVNITDITQSLRNQILKIFDNACSFSNISFQLNCMSCSNNWESLFDILSFLWNEINLWAKKFLYQVLLLAKNLGWSEHEIISLSPNRRYYYLSLINGQ